MAIEKRTSRGGKVTYRARLRIKGFEDMSSSHPRLTDARDWEARMLAQIKSGRSVIAVHAQQHTCAQAIDRYIELLPSLRLKDHSNRVRQAKWWREEIGDLALAGLTAPRISMARDRLLQTPIVVKRLGSPLRYRQPATVVRYLATLSHILSFVVDEWEWLEVNPMRKVRKPRQPRGRTRYLSLDERDRLLIACRASRSRSLYPATVLALATGMRRGEFLSLRWSHVDLDRGTVTLETTKNDEPRQVPVVAQGLEVLTQWAERPHDQHDYVFPGRSGNRLTDFHHAWKTALKKAGITDFRFHDLRHTTASYLAMNGASVLEIGEILGHKSTQMTKRYAHVSTAHSRLVLLAVAPKLLPSASSGLPLDRPVPG